MKLIVSSTFVIEKPVQPDPDPDSMLDAVVTTDGQCVCIALADNSVQVHLMFEELHAILDLFENRPGAVI